MSSNSLGIYDAQIKDISAMLEFWRSTDGIGVGVGDDDASLQLFLKRNPTTCLVMKDSGRLIGTVLGGFDGRRGFIYHLAIQPDYRRQGLGKKLLDQALNELAKAGAQRTHLFVWKENQAAIDFYRSLGWLDRNDIEVFTWVDEAMTQECTGTCRC